MSTSVFQLVGDGVQFTVGEVNLVISIGDAPSSEAEFLNRTSALLGGERTIDSSGQVRLLFWDEKEG